MKDMKEENNTTQQEEPNYENYEEYLKSTEICDDIEEETEWER
ncbi:MAG: hypothetical protein ACOYIG_14085 [Acetivibrionales bacterium]|jgi:hypothetical protein